MSFSPSPEKEAGQTHTLKAASGLQKREPHFCLARFSERERAKSKVFHDHPADFVTIKKATQILWKNFGVTGKFPKDFVVLFDESVSPRKRM